MFQTKAWLESPKSGPWTMIVDNADNLLEMFPPKDEDGNQPIGLASFLPQGSKGTILITTRDRIVASRLANTDMHEVKALGLVEAEDLLVYYAQDAISGTREREAIPKLLEVLKYLPLAIVATAAFMRETGTFPTEYIELYSQGRMAQRELLCSELSDFHVPEAVLTIYFTLFGWLQRQSPMATEFLRLIAFLDRNGIPKELLIKSGIDGVESPARFARAIGKLFSCSLITKSSDGKMYQVHQLVHISIGMFFPDDDNKWKLRALDTLLSIFQVTTDKGAAGRECNWDLCAKYSPHAISVLKSLEDTSSTAGMQLSSRLGIYFGLIGRYEDAQLHLKQAIKLHESETEGDLRKNDIIDAYLSLGQVFEVRDRANDATELYLGVLGRCEKEFGPEHTSVATLLDRLTKLFKKHQNFSLEKAEELGRRALAGKQKLLAPEHLDLVPDINNLAKVLRLQLRFGEAVQLLQRAVMLAETHLDPKDPAVLLSLIRLSRALQLDLNYPEAQRILDQALQASEAITTSDPATLRSFTKLGRALFCQGNTTQSSQILQRAITISQTLQADDATAVPSQIWVTKLAKLLHLCGNIQQAESTYTLVLRRNQQLPGPSHAHMLENLFSLGDVLRDLNHFSEAEDAYQRALGGFETAYGPSNQNTINCRARLGILHAFQGNRVGAEQECKDVHEAYRNVYGKDHLRTLRTKAVMDFCLFEAGDMEGKTVFETVKTAQYVAILMFPPPPMPPVAPARVKRVSTAEILSDEPLD